MRALALLLLAGCGDPAVVDHALWQPAPAVLEPVDAAPCAVFGVEAPYLEVNTGVCPHLSLAQPSLRALAPGDVLATGLVWDVLWAEAPAEGHVAVLLDGEVLWERFVPIPADAGAEPVEVVIDRAVAAGAPVQLHLHNHGSNHWRLLPLELR